MLPALIAAREPTCIQLMAAMRQAGRLSNLKIGLDAIDKDSYSSGQPWLDRSGGGFDFNRGAANGAEASDPTFTNTAGMPDAYWAFDGGDWFTYDSANETFMEAWHKDNALYTFLCWIYPAPTAQYVLFGNNGGAATVGTGVHFLVGADSGTVMSVRAVNAGVAALDYTDSTIAPTRNAWNFVALSLNEAGGAGASFIKVNGTVNTFNATYTSPSTGTASQVTQIGARGNGSSPLTSGSRLGCAAFFDTNLSAAQLEEIRTLMRPRFGV